MRQASAWSQETSVGAGFATAATLLAYSHEMHSDLDVRSASDSDAAAIAALHAASWRRHYRGAYADSFLDGDVEADRLAVWSARLGTPDPQLVTVVVEAPAGLAGFAHAVLDKDEQWGTLVDNLHVALAYQRNGVGARLMESIAEAVGVGPMYLWVLEQNVAAQAFYRRLGGQSVERALVPPPGGVPSRLNGSPSRLRMCWPDASVLAG